jgi:hypothetical protein
MFLPPIVHPPGTACGRALGRPRRCSTRRHSAGGRRHGADRGAGAGADGRGAANTRGTKGPMGWKFVNPANLLKSLEL